MACGGWDRGIGAVVVGVGRAGRGIYKALGWPGRQGRCGHTGGCRAE